MSGENMKNQCFREQKSPTELWAMLYVKCNWILPPYSRQDDEFGVTRNNWTLHFVQGDECVYVRVTSVECRFVYFFFAVDFFGAVK